MSGGTGLNGAVLLPLGERVPVVAPDAWVAPGRPPTRACVEARLASPKYAVEIRVLAAR